MLGNFFLKIKKAIKFLLRRALNRNQTVIDGIRLSFPESPQKLKNHLFSGGYEKSERIILGRVLEPKDVILEIGTSIGLLSSIIARKIGSSQVVTVEANSETADYAIRNHKRNNLEPTVLKGLVSFNTDKTKFNVNQNFYSSSVLDKVNTIGTVELDSLDLNSLINEYKPNFLIMDVEGYEIELITHVDFPESVTKLLIEFHQNIVPLKEINRCIQKLISQGYNLDLRLSIKDSLYFAR